MEILTRSTDNFELLIDNSNYWIKIDQYSEWEIARYESVHDCFRTFNGTIYESFNVRAIINKPIDKPDASLFYVEYLNKDKKFKKDTVFFDSYNDAVNWCRSNLEKYNADMINII